jgi:hypothetical protein
MANQTDTPKTIGARLAFAYSLYPTPEVFSLRNLDEWCEPRLGGGHCAQIIAGNVIPRAIAAAVRLDREGFDEFEADLEIPGEGWRDAILIGASSSTFRPGEAM